MEHLIFLLLEYIYKANYLNYCYHLAYQDTPNYDELINIFSSSQESRPVPQDQQVQARAQR